MDFKAARQRMVDSQVRPNDVTDLRLQLALEETPRELFLPLELRDQAYIEREIAYGSDRALITARDFSKLLTAASPRSEDLALIAVCGSGYSTAVLARLVDMVVSVESDEGTAGTAQDNLTKLDVTNAAVITGDCTKGAPKQGPFDLILVDGVLETRPEALLSQLNDGGRLATIMRIDGVSRGVIFRRTGDVFACTEKFDATAKRVVPGFEAKKNFVF